MKQLFIIILSVLSIYFSEAQVGNSKDIILNNNVKSSLEKYLFINSNESCMIIFEAYDKRGNVTEWDMRRLGFKDRHLYDAKNRKIATLRIDKSDTIKIDTIQQYVYDKYDQIISEKDTELFINSYDRQNCLIKKTSTFVNSDRDSLVETELYTWTSFNKIESEYKFTLKKGHEKDTLRPTFKSYEYNSYEDLIQEIHYEENEIVNMICYDYDTSLRLIQKKEYDYKGIEFWNSEYSAYKGTIEFYETKIVYDSKGRIKEKYTYFSDRCMSLDDHFTFKYFYKKNDLLHKVEASNAYRKMFVITYEYTFFETLS